MARMPWKRLTINLPEKDYNDLRLLGGVDGISMGERVRQIISEQIKINAPLIKLLEKALNESKSCEP